MQSRALIALALLAAQWASVESISAVSQARLFLRRHAGTAPQVDELAELNRQNPEAYALVKALLTKRSLGLLNPRHPTASFATPTAEQQEQSETAEQGPEVYSQFASPGELSASHSHGHRESLVAKVAVPYADVQPAASRDWLNWKPNQANDDDQMVQNVLGAVAELKGKKAGLLSKRSSEESSLATDESAFAVEEPKAAPVRPAAPPAAPQENGYLKSIDFGIKAPETEQPAAAPRRENSYLKGLDLNSDMPKDVSSTETSKKTSQVQGSSASYLSSFSWDDSKPQVQEHVKVARQPEAQADAKGNTLLAWLGGSVSKEPAPKAAPAAAAKPSNPYMMDLS